MLTATTNRGRGDFSAAAQAGLASNRTANRISRRDGMSMVFREVAEGIGPGGQTSSVVDAAQRFLVPRKIEPVGGI